jgi:hypothetical protein
MGKAVRKSGPGGSEVPRDLASDALGIVSATRGRRRVTLNQLAQGSEQLIDRAASGRSGVVANGHAGHVPVHMARKSDPWRKTGHGAAPA